MGFLRPAGAWPRAVWALSLMLLMVWAFSGCEENGVEPSSPDGVPLDSGVIDSLSVPEFWVLGSEDYRTVYLSLGLTVEEREAILDGDLLPPSVYIWVGPAGDNEYSNNFRLLDDGGALVNQTNAEYADSLSGDLIPGDQVFQARINSGFADEAGDYVFYVQVVGLQRPGNATDEGSDPILEVTVTVSANEPPVFSDPNLPDSLHAGFDAQQWSVNVVDPNESLGDDVVDVMMELKAGDIVYRENLFAELDAPVWTFTADSTFAAGLETAEYTMSFTASDQFDQVTDPPFEHTVWIENSAPDLLSLSAPDTAYQPGPDDPPNVYAFELNVEDHQGQGDIEEVYYEVTDPTGNHYGNPAFVFRDDGEDPDPVAGDRIWSHGFIVTSSVSNFGTYTFTFYARDRAGNVSDPIEHELELISSSEPQP